MKQAHHFSIPREGLLLEEKEEFLCGWNKLIFFIFFFLNKMLTSHLVKEGEMQSSNQAESAKLFCSKTLPCQGSHRSDISFTIQKTLF